MMKKKFSAVNVRLSSPRVVIRFFSSSKMIITGCSNEGDLEKAARIGAYLIALYEGKSCKYALESIKSVEITNVMCSLTMEDQFGCGVIGNIFDDKAKYTSFAGGTYVLKKNGGTLRIFQNGKIVGMGFKKVDDAIKTLAGIAEIIIDAIDTETGKRSDSCKLERLDPTKKLIKENGALLGTSREVIDMALKIISCYCEKVVEEPFGGNPESFAVAALYMAGILCGEKRNQEDIYKKTGVSSSALRSARDKIVEKIGLTDFFKIRIL